MEHFLLLCDFWINGFAVLLFLPWQILRHSAHDETNFPVDPNEGHDEGNHETKEEHPVTRSQVTIELRAAHTEENGRNSDRVAKFPSERETEYGALFGRNLFMSDRGGILLLCLWMVWENVHKGLDGATAAGT